MDNEKLRLQIDEFIDELESGKLENGVHEGEVFLNSKWLINFLEEILESL